MPPKALQRQIGPYFYIAGTGSSTTGALYSFGACGSTEPRAGFAGFRHARQHRLWRPRSRTTRLRRRATFTISLHRRTMAEANANVQTRSLFLIKSAIALTNADARTRRRWTAFPALNFTTPITGGTAGALDGNAAGQSQCFHQRRFAGRGRAAGTGNFFALV